jgi:hypothetical protein
LRYNPEYSGGQVDRFLRTNLDSSGEQGGVTCVPPVNILEDAKAVSLVPISTLLEEREAVFCLLPSIFL